MYSGRLFPITVFLFDNKLPYLDDKGLFSKEGNVNNKK